MLDKIQAMNGSSIQSADNKATLIITSISLIVGFYTAFIIGPVLSETLLNPMQFINVNDFGIIFWILQILLGISAFFCISFSVWTIWPRFNIRDENPLNAPQMFFFHYIAGDPPKGRKKILEFIENVFPVRRGRNSKQIEIIDPNDENKQKKLKISQVEAGKMKYKEKIENLSPNSILAEYNDQIWELAQIAERKMWLIRGGIVWFFVSNALFFLTLILFFLNTILS